MKSYHVTEFYHATGMEYPYRYDWGNISANSKKEAIDTICMKKYPEELDYIETANGYQLQDINKSSREFFNGCLTAREIKE